MGSLAIMERFAAGRLLFDGGMGSALIARGLPPGHAPEEWNATKSDVVKGVHLAYLDAGADVIETNTFGATPARFASHGLADRVAELNARAVALARDAIAEFEENNQSTRRRFVAFSMGPCGEMLPPVGAANEHQVRAEFAEQLNAVRETNAPDLVLIETMVDLREALIALAAAKETLDVPVAVSLTYNRTPRGFYTVMGDEASASAKRLDADGADVVAANCSIASRDMVDLAKILRGATTRPVLCQPNAGEPAFRDGAPVYDQAPEEFAGHALEMLDAVGGVGVDAVGGCCGTTPEFIRCVSEALGRR